MTIEYNGDSQYKNYCLEQLDNWVNDSLNCEGLAPQEIYDTLMKSINESTEYHKKQLEKNEELLSLMKDRSSVDFLEKYKTSPFSKATEKDWEDFWNENYSPEEIREFELKERDYERKRATLDAQYKENLEEIRENGGFEWTPNPKHSKHYYDHDRNDLNRINPFKQ